MNFKTRGLVAFLIISVFLLSGCEVYQTLYGTSPQQATGQVTAPSEESSMEKEAAPSDAMVEKEEPNPEAEGQAAMEPAEEVKEAKPEETAAPETQAETPKGNPVVVVVQETELVSLSPSAEDPDKDTNLAFTFTSPLAENGEWQTNYGDAGEYTVTVTASDGELTTTQDVLIIVNKKEENPAIDSARPIESGLSIDETQALEFSIEASDLNNDQLSYAWKLDGADVGTETSYTYQSTYEDAGTHTVKVEASDGLSSASKLWSVDVSNVNRKPVLEQLEDMTLRETDKITITALATDDDRDAITYSISDSRFVKEENVFTWQTDYDSAGTYEVTVSASDGQDTTEQALAITVQNVNRPPVIKDIVQKK